MEASRSCGRGNGLNHSLKKDSVSTFELTDRFNAGCEGNTDIFTVILRCLSAGVQLACFWTYLNTKMCFTFACIVK